MRSFVRLVLLIAACAGLMGQAVAFAAVPVAMPAMATTMQAPAMNDCDTMTAMTGDTSAPCKKMTADCAATMGCATPAAIIGDRLVRSTDKVAALPAIWPAVTSLDGLTLSPEPHPPSSLPG